VAQEQGHQGESADGQHPDQVDEHQRAGQAGEREERDRRGTHALSGAADDGILTAFRRVRHLGFDPAGRASIPARRDVMPMPDSDPDPDSDWVRLSS
jgi:hypothetical protein